jgi:hypothetical protein
MNSETMKDYWAGLRDQMATMLTQCTGPQQDLFRRMYNHQGKYSRDVDGVRDEQMDNAFSQIERTLANNAKALTIAPPQSKQAEGK